MNQDSDRIVPEFWEKAWDESHFSKYYGVEEYQAINRRLRLLRKRVLANDSKWLLNDNKRILELGCAGGKQLIYFAKEFGYEIYGIDTSERGVAIARANLKRAGVQGTILCEDMFETSFNKGFFDIVYSMGLVEHFDKPEEVIDVHIGLLKRGGILMITVPNFNGSIHLAFRKLVKQDKALLETHNLTVMDKKVMGELIQSRGLEVLYLDYIGMIELTLGFGGITNRFLLYPMLLLNQLIGYLTFFLPGSKYFSPYLVVVARKV